MARPTRFGLYKLSEFVLVFGFEFDSDSSHYPHSDSNSIRNVQISAFGFEFDSDSSNHPHSDSNSIRIAQMSAFEFEFDSF